MTTPAETVGNGSEEAEAANKTDKVIDIVQAFGFGEKVLDEVEAGKEAGKDVGEVLDVNKGVFPEHVRMSPFVKVDGQELALRDHMRNGKPATAILELVSRGEDGEEKLVGSLGASKVWTTDPESHKHVLQPETAGVPQELGPIIASVAKAVHERIEAVEPQRQLPAAA